MKLSEDLRGRTKAFAAKVIRLYVSLPKQREEVRVVGKQLLRSGTSVAAHAREASRARSDAELCSKLGGLLQEAERVIVERNSEMLKVRKSETGLSLPFRVSGFPRFRLSLSFQYFNVSL